MSNSMKSGDVATGAIGNSASVNNDGRKSDSKMNTPKKKYLSVQGALTNNSPVVKSLFHSEEKDDDLENKLLQPTARVRGELDLESHVTESLLDAITCTVKIIDILYTMGSHIELDDRRNSYF